VLLGAGSGRLVDTERLLRLTLGHPPTAGTNRGLAMTQGLRWMKRQSSTTFGQDSGSYLYVVVACTVCLNLDDDRRRQGPVEG
jgi:hypothetical protein